MKWLVVFIISAYSLVATAEDGFDDSFDNEIIGAISNDQSSDKNFLYGSIDFETHYNTNNNKNLSSFKFLIDIIGEYKINDTYKIKGNLKGYHDFIYGSDSNYTTVPDGYENEINFNELTIEGNIGSKFDFKIGRQIVVWGKSDVIRITDILNPLDNRIPGLVDIKNLRLGRVMSKFDYYINNFDLSLIALHENRFSKLPKFGSDFQTMKDKDTNKPNNNLSNTGYALSMTGAFEGYDLGLYFADMYIDKPYFTNNILQYDNKSKMLGIAYNQVFSNFLLKSEIAYFDNIQYSIDAKNIVAKSRADVLLGLEYNGIIDGSIGYEIASRTINNYTKTINNPFNAYKEEKEYQQAIRFNQTYLNQALELNIVLNVFGISAQNGGSARMSLNYKFNDQSSISGGVIDYLSGDNATIDAYKNNDRIFITSSYLF